jgi:hypothetical protein
MELSGQDKSKKIVSVTTLDLELDSLKAFGSLLEGRNR